MKQYLKFDQNPVFGLRDNMQELIPSASVTWKKVKVIKIKSTECRELAFPHHYAVCILEAKYPTLMYTSS